jgi:hypothetical protein
MGAEQFTSVGNGATAQAAFEQAHDEACYDYGHRGYTGSLAEKDCFTEIVVPEGKSAIEFSDELLENCDERVDDKWGPAGCVKMEEGKYLFFGWASS